MLWVGTKLLTPMFGRQRLILDYDKFVVATSLFGFGRRRVFEVDLVGGFSASEMQLQAHGVKHAAPAIAFRYAGREFVVAAGRSRRELDWLEGELNRLLEQHRRR